MKLARWFTLAAVLTGVTVLSGCIEFSAGQGAVTDIDGVEVIATTPTDVDSYMSEFGDRGGWMDGAGVVAEYERAAAIFPFPLPHGYMFPAEPILFGEDDLYEVGYGSAQAFEFFMGATATAAKAAYDRGDERLASELIDVYEQAYLSEIRPLYADPELPGGSGPEMTETIAPARNGDYRTMQVMKISGFLARDENRIIAEAAGDV